MKENKMKIYSVFINWKAQYWQDVDSSSPQIDLQIQHSPNQNLINFL